MELFWTPEADRDRDGSRRCRQVEPAAAPCAYFSSISMKATGESPSLMTLCEVPTPRL